MEKRRIQFVLSNIKLNLRIIFVARFIFWKLYTERKNIQDIINISLVSTNNTFTYTNYVVLHWEYIVKKEKIYILLNL